MRRFPRFAIVLGVMLAIGGPAAGPARAEDDLPARVVRSREVFQELVKAPDREIPEALLKDCKCVAIFPHVIKGAFVFGARRGKGVVSCRNAAGEWSPPAFFSLTGGSWGLQIGAESADVVLFFMTERGAKSLLESKFTLGGQLAVAAGPAGRSAEASTDAKLEAEIYSYARSKGLFAGLSLEGARLSPDTKSIQSYYGEPVETRAILFQHKVPRRPPEAAKLVGALP
jgi:lipid-binding SYLF domain-containing protein